LTTPATVAELDRARTEVVNELVAISSKPEMIPDPWLDAATYRLNAVQDQLALLRTVTPADIQRLANRLLKNATVATVVTGEPGQIKPTLQGRFEFEVLGEVAPPAPAPKPPAKPTSSGNPR
jgi:predicted Zn-dependent peptidase